MIPNFTSLVRCILITSHINNNILDQSSKSHNFKGDIIVAGDNFNNEILIEIIRS